MSQMATRRGLSLADLLERHETIALVLERSEQAVGIGALGAWNTTYGEGLDVDFSPTHGCVL